MISILHGLQPPLLLLLRAAALPNSRSDGGVPGVRFVDAPLECVVLGAGRCIESYEAVKAMFMKTGR